MIKEVSTLISNLTGFVIGTKLQAGHLQQGAPERCVIVLETGGPADFYPIHDQVDLGIQVTCQAPSYADAHEDAFTVFRALHGGCGYEMPGQDGGPDLLVNTIEAVASPQYLGEDEERRHLFTINFTFRIEEGSCS
jgi:hypothetical protein